MRRSILSWVNPCYPNRGSCSIPVHSCLWVNFDLGHMIVSSPAIQAQGRISIAASPVTSGFEEDMFYRLRVSEGYMLELPGSKSKDQVSNGSTESNRCSLNNIPHPIDIERGPTPVDKVRCRVKSIQPSGLRQ
ncbi:hypothetical protein Bca101_082906 [Brassica carinata]